MQEIRGGFIWDIPKLKILGFIDWACAGILLVAGVIFLLFGYNYWFIFKEDGDPKILFSIAFGIIFVARAIILPFEIMEMKVNEINKKELERAAKLN